MLKGALRVAFPDSLRNFWGDDSLHDWSVLGVICILFPLCIAHTGCARKKTPYSPRNIHVTGVEKALNNFHSVQSGLLYRSAQLTPKFLEKMIKKLGIKTVINLRGKNQQSRWWQQEKALVKKLGVALYDVQMAASRSPEKQSLIKLLDIYQCAHKPILIHCYGGADRTGEAAALWILEQQKLSKKEALKQLSLKYGHFRLKYPAKRNFIKKWQGKQWLYSRI